MRITFWNLRHLSGGSDEERKNAIDTTITNLDGEYAFYCELTTASKVPRAQNLTYRRESPRQLCYGATQRSHIDNSWVNTDLVKYTPDESDEYKQWARKGGNNFALLADRAVGQIRIQVDGAPIDVYVLHAPASSDGIKAVAFLACHLHAKAKAAKGPPWLIIGDLNVEPDELRAAGVGIKLDDYIVEPDRATYIKTDKKYDYVLTSLEPKPTLTVIRTSDRFHGSDHLPIMVEFATSSTS